MYRLNNAHTWKERQATLAIVENAKITEEINRTSEKKVYFVQRFSSALRACHEKFNDIANSSQTEDILEFLIKTAAVYGVTYLTKEVIFNALKTHKGEEIGDGAVIAIVAIYAYLKSREIKERARQREIAKSFLRLFNKVQDITAATLKIAEWIYSSHQLQIELMQKNSEGIGLFVNFLVDLIVRGGIEDEGNIENLNEDQHIRKIFEYINRCPIYWRKTILRTEGERSLDWTLGAIILRSPVIIMPTPTSVFELWNISESSKMNYPREGKYAPRVFMYKNDVVQKDNFTQRKLFDTQCYWNIASEFETLCAELHIIEEHIQAQSYQTLLHDVYLGLTDYYKANFGMARASCSKNTLTMFVKLVYWCQLNKNTFEARVLMANLLNIGFVLRGIISQRDSEKLKVSISIIFLIEKEFLKSKIMVNNEACIVTNNKDSIEEYNDSISFEEESNKFQPDHFSWTQECKNFLLWSTGLDIHIKRQEILKQRLEIMKEERSLANRFSA